MRRRGRFIGRNFFLSAYVFSVTGRRRTAKQVGSRLQQLKDTCREPTSTYRCIDFGLSSRCGLISSILDNWQSFTVSPT